MSRLISKLMTSAKVGDSQSEITLTSIFLKFFFGALLMAFIWIY